MLPQDGIKERYTQSAHMQMVHLCVKVTVLWLKVWDLQIILSFIKKVVFFTFWCSLSGFFKKCMEVVQVCYVCVCVHASQGVRHPNSPTHTHNTHNIILESHQHADSFVFISWIFDFEGLTLLFWLPSLKTKKQKQKTRMTYMSCVYVYFLLHVLNFASFLCTFPRSPRGELVRICVKA